MKTIFSLLLTCTLFFACASKKTSPISIVQKNTQQTLEGYGYSEKDPVKVGGAFTNGVILSKQYLNGLSGLNGEPISYYRIGSCCPFETPNSPFGQGVLDKYSVRIEGDSTEKIIYINMYDSAELYAPEGFKFKK